MRAIGRKITELRDFRGLTQEQLADRIGVSTDAIAKVERGQHFPRFRSLLALSRGLKVPLRDLLDEELLTGSGNDVRGRLELRGRTLLHGLSDEFLAIAVQQLSAFSKSR
jgi:transcriptional regulator with XRE-family HTH domain